MKIMIVEDDEEIRQFLALYLTEHGFEVVEVGTGKELLGMFTYHNPDLLLLDVLLPDQNGFDICKILRKQTEIPILLLTCKWESDDIIKGLELGADDYITKPFEPGILLARIKANLRRNNNDRNTIKFGDLEIDLHEYKVKVGNVEVTLYTKEVQLLVYLAQNPNIVFTVEQLYEAVWGEEKYGMTETVKVHISSLRKKIENSTKSPKYIKTIWGIGYKFDKDAK